MQAYHFHPAVAAWFHHRFTSPSPCQQRAWPAIQAGRHTLIAAPTGSGKTLAAFLAAIDTLVNQGLNEGLKDRTQVLYISPLKALSNDIQRNLEQPLEGIRNRLFELGCPDVFIQAQVRSGDTPAAARAAMARRPPHILVTTPESFYLLLTSDSGRRMLKTVTSVIVDEIHALVGSKRGAHLALSLQRLEHLTGPGLLRIGLSATQNPIAEVARFLVGDPGRACEIIDTGHHRRLDLALELPDSPLEALLSSQAAKEQYDRLAALIESHRTTLIFVNTRRMAERVARHLSERVGADNITSHHGSLAREQRLSAESRLKSGALKALVATASLELGIDIGEIDLVCQIGSTGAIATLLQRVGRSGHSAGGLPKGRLFPTSRDELIECIALLDAVRRHQLDRLCIPCQPLDVLAQQVVAMVACEEWPEDELYCCVRAAYPYRDLDRAEFEQVLEMLSNGYSTQRGRRSAYLHRDRIQRRLRPRKGARLTAITCGGAIPDNADYRVILEPGEEFIGTVDEDFAIESLAGDIFQLGNSSWQVVRVEAGNLRVLDAANQPPSIPFWFGEAPGRSWEASRAVSRLRREIAARCSTEQPADTRPARRWLQETLGLQPSAAEQAANYIAATRICLGAMPDFNTLVLERFFDESGGMQLILHAPFGSRLNRAWGLALRKRFCRSFNFELQAAATENAIILSLGTSQSFALAEVARYLNPATVRDLLVQALLDAPMFTIRWRWNACCALALKRFQGGRKTPPYLIRMQAEDLVTGIFPDQLACLENIQGDREIPDHPLVRQTLHDCLTEAMDIERLEAVLRRIQSGAMAVVARDLVEPSPFAAEILTARNYAFLDGAPAEERRTRAVISRRWLDPAEASDLGQLDPAAIEQLQAEIWPRADDADELHDALVVAGFMVEPDDIAGHWPALFQQLQAQGRASRMIIRDHALWLAAEHLTNLQTLQPEASASPPLSLPATLATPPPTPEAALIGLLRPRLGCSGPVQAQPLAQALGLEPPRIEQALAMLENEGLVLRGLFSPGAETTEWCERRLLARIHRHTLQQLRKSIAPVSSADYMRFLLGWQHLHPDHRLKGSEALAAVMEQLEGFEAAAGAWEQDLLAARLEGYDPAWLDALCLSGKLTWGRLSTGRGAGPLRTAPISFLPRRARGHWQTAGGPREMPPLGASAGRVAEILEQKGALFFEELLEYARMLKTQLENALAELVAQGRVSCDSYTGLRALLTPDSHRRGRLRARWEMADAGRWTLLATPTSAAPDPEALEHIARALLKRYGVVFRSLLYRERVLPPWNRLLTVYRRLEARGEIRGGRFVSSQAGEQFALPEAVERLRRIQKEEKDSESILVSAADPLNLLGIVIPGEKLSAVASNRILYQDGIAQAIQNGQDLRFLQNPDPARREAIRRQLQPAPGAARRRAYPFGKSW